MSYADADVPAVVDGGGGPEAQAPVPAGLGASIVVPASQMEQWVWIPIPEMRCADDTPAGVGVNFTEQSRDLLVYFQGNGVCYDAITCNLFKDLLVGMGDDPLDHMWWGNKTVGSEGVFARKDAKNPFRKSNYVVIPHCTIDAHTGDKDSTYPGVGTVHQHGYRNVSEAIKRIVPTFADSPQIVLSGYSAGGIGVTANYHQLAAAFASVGRPPPFLINDAGPIMRAPYLSAGGQSVLREAWGLADTIGKFCPQCLTNGDLHEIYAANAMLHPGLRSAQLCAYGDATVTGLYALLNGGGSLVDQTWITNGLLDQDAWLAGRQAALAPSAHRSYFYHGLDHGTIWGSITTKPDLLAFLAQQLGGDPSWTSVTP